MTMLLLSQTLTYLQVICLTPNFKVEPNNLTRMNRIKNLQRIPNPKHPSFKRAQPNTKVPRTLENPSTKQQLESDEEEENDDEDFDENDNVAQESPEEDEIQADSVETEEPTAKSGSQKRGKGVVKPTKAGTKTQVIKPAISKKKIMATPEKKKKPKKATHKPTPLS
eukprot:14415_4